MPSLKAIYQAATAEAAEAALEAFEASPGPNVTRLIAPMWRRAVAPGLGVRHGILRLPAGDPEDDLYNERGGGLEPKLAQGDQDARQLPL